jgi:hypothetical protein
MILFEKYSTSSLSRMHALTKCRFEQTQPPKTLETEVAARQLWIVKTSVPGMSECDCRPDLCHALARVDARGKRESLVQISGSEGSEHYSKDVIVLSARFFKSTHWPLCPFVALHQTSLFCSFSISDRCSSSTFWSESYCATNLRLQLLHNGRHRRERNTVTVWSTERRLDKIIA